MPKGPAGNTNIDVLRSGISGCLKVFALFSTVRLQIPRVPPCERHPFSLPSAICGDRCHAPRLRDRHADAPGEIVGMVVFWRGCFLLVVLWRGWWNTAEMVRPTDIVEMGKIEGSTLANSECWRGSSPLKRGGPRISRPGDSCYLNYYYVKWGIPLEISNLTKPYVFLCRCGSVKSFSSRNISMRVSTEFHQHLTSSAWILKPVITYY